MRNVQHVFCRLSRRSVFLAGLMGALISLGACGGGNVAVPMMKQTLPARIESRLAGPFMVTTQQYETRPAEAEPDLASFDAAVPEVVPDELIVAMKPGRRLMMSNHDTGRGDIDVGRRYQVVKVPPGMSRDDAVRYFATRAGVDAVHVNRVYQVGTVVNDPLWKDQWGMHQTRLYAQAAWAKGVNGRGVLVAVLDTGVDYEHPDLKGRVVLGPDLANQDADPMDRFGHGTHVAGIIAASGNNGLGVAGVAWASRILAVQVLGDRGKGNTGNVVAGIKYAVDHGARVINMSLGTNDPVIDPVLHQALVYARDKGVLVVSAAGNNRGQVGSPANDPIAIAVSSSSSFGPFEWSSFFSNYGEKIEVAAPGGGIVSTLPSKGSVLGRDYGKLSGTSQATPFVSGAAALIIGQHPEWSAAQVRVRLRQGVDDKGPPGRDARWGFGRINLSKVLM